MSLCIAKYTNDGIIVNADTRGVYSDNLQSDNIRKIYVVGNNVIFMSGLMKSNLEVIERLDKEVLNYCNLDSFVDFVSKTCREVLNDFIEKNPDYMEKLTFGFNTHQEELALPINLNMFTYSNNEYYYIRFHIKFDFKPKYYIMSAMKNAVVITGLCNNEAANIYKRLKYLFEPIELIQKVFDEISITQRCINSTLDTYLVTKSGIQEINVNSIDQLEEKDYILMDKTGNITLLDEDGIMQTWQDSRADNVDSTHGLILNVYLPSETKLINKAFLRFKLQAFRAYEIAASSGGASTSTSASGGGGTITSASGGSGFTTSADGGGGQVTDNSYRYISGWSSDSTGSNGSHIHTIPDGTILRKADGGTVTWGYGGQHSHAIPMHGHNISIPAHSHSVSISNHTHTVSISNHSHSVPIPAHVHGIVYGIYESTAPTSVTVKVNTTTVGTYSSDQTSINLSSYLTIGGWNTITITPNQLGRIDSSIFIQAKMGV